MFLKLLSPQIAQKLIITAKFRIKNNMPLNCWPCCQQQCHQSHPNHLKPLIFIFYDIRCSETIHISFLFQVIFMEHLITHFMIIILTDFHWNFHKFTFFHLLITIKKNQIPFICINYTTSSVLSVNNIVKY